METDLPEMTDPGELVKAMLAAGFKQVGGQAGKYARMEWPIGDNGTLMVPLDTEAGDFAPLMAGLWLALADALIHGNAARAVIAELGQAEERPLRAARDRAEAFELLADWAPTTP